MELVGDRVAKNGIWIILHEKIVNLHSVAESECADNKRPCFYKETLFETPNL